MRLRLDTPALLWFLTDLPKLSPSAKAALLDPANERRLSPISLLEIAIKTRLGKLPIHAPFAVLFPAQLVANRIGLSPIEAKHVEPLTRMPMHHKDPFDRRIAATALVEGLALVSADSAFDAYGLTRLW
jgi:PIN domain nuclease of toxin-antitoxin system